MIIIIILIYNIVILFSFDSVMLLEEGFKVTSVDASDKMLKYALKKRWERRKEPAFDKWGMYYVPMVVNVALSLVETTPWTDANMLFDLGGILR